MILVHLEIEAVIHLAVTEFDVVGQYRLIGFLVVRAQVGLETKQTDFGEIEAVFPARTANQEIFSARFEIHQLGFERLLVHQIDPNLNAIAPPARAVSDPSGISSGECIADVPDNQQHHVRLN